MVINPDWILHNNESLVSAAEVPDPGASEILPATTLPAETTSDIQDWLGQFVLELDMSEN